MSIKIHSTETTDTLKMLMEKITITDLVLSEYITEFTINQKLFTYASIVFGDEFKNIESNPDDIKGIIKNVRMGIVELGEYINTFNIFFDKYDVKEYIIGLAFQLSAYKAFKDIETLYTNNDDNNLYALRFKNEEQQDRLHLIVTLDNFNICEEIYERIHSRQADYDIDTTMLNHIDTVIQDDNFTSSLLSLEPIFGFSEDDCFESIKFHTNFYMEQYQNIIKICDKHLVKYENLSHIDKTNLDLYIATYCSVLFDYFLIDEKPFIKKFLFNAIISSFITKDRLYMHPTIEDNLRYSIKKYKELYSTPPHWLNQFIDNDINSEVALFSFFAIQIFYFFKTNKIFENDSIEDALKLKSSDPDTYNLVLAMSLVILTEFNKVYGSKETVVNHSSSPIDNKSARDQATKEFYSQQYAKPQKRQKKLKRTYSNSTNNKSLKIAIVILSCILLLSLITIIIQQVHFNTQIEILSDKINQQKEYTQHYKDMYIDLKNAIKKSMNGEELSFAEYTALQNIEYRSDNY